MAKVAINGFGRIGRSTLKNILKNHPDFEVVAINDLSDPKTLAHLFKYDSLYGTYDKDVKFDEDELFIGEKRIKVFAEKDPSNLPWEELGVDVVLECTGVFRTRETAGKHITAGAKKVIISAPAKDGDIPSYILGVNAEDYDNEKDDIVDMASCTTNCLAPIAKVLNEKFGIVKGYMTTVHSYTADQELQDAPHKDLRRARAAALSIIPTTTGATEAVCKTIPGLLGKLDGMALRVPTPTVSLVDFFCELEKEATAEEINDVLREASKTEELKGVLACEDLPLVSIDYKGNSNASIVDTSLTKANGKLIKVVSWYDNEWGYSAKLADFAKFVSEKI